MNTLTVMIGLGFCVAAQSETPSSSPAGRPGTEFPLKRQVVPDQKMQSPPHRGYVQVEPVTKLPPGVNACEGAVKLIPTIGPRLPLARGFTAQKEKGPYLQAVEGAVTIAGRPYKLFLAKTHKEAKCCDRLYLDVDADGKFDESESWDITRSAKPVEVRPAPSNYRQATVHSIKLVLSQGGKEHDYWIDLSVMQAIGKEGRIDYLWVGYTSQTCVLGKVAFGDKTDLIAVHDIGCTGRFDVRFELPTSQPVGRRGRMATPAPCQILLDVNGNGQFDLDGYRFIGSENRWLTRLIRRQGAYYELVVAPDGSSIRVTPATPAIGTLAVAKECVSADLVGPEFAASLAGEDKEPKLPAGQYVLHHYSWRAKGSTLTVYDWDPKGTFDVKADQASTLSAGPPLKMSLDVDQPKLRAKTGSQAAVRLQLQMTDCAGRPLSDISTPLGRPAPPRFKILDPAGKQVTTGTFEFG